ncbi:hypothetical protein MKX01_014237 [Papaver californicum]|nr:hypothetical protein MKX01_014237 [Papaver californicum]
MAIGLINNNILKVDSSFSSSLYIPASFDFHVVVLYAFKPPMPSNEVWKDALSKVLVYYPHLAGRFITDGRGRTCIILNNAGVRITETYTSTTLAEQLPFNPSKDISHLLPPVEGVEELFQIKLNRYACGGLVIGETSHHHCFADGQSMSSFFLAWARMVRGLDLELLPYHDRFVVSQPRNPPPVKKTTVNPNTTPVISSIETLIINYSTEFINKMKAKVLGENCNPHQRYSTFECLLSHTWTQARRLDLEDSIQVRVAVNGRARIKPAVPMEYFGNLVLWVYPTLKVKELLQESHAYVSKAIHDEDIRVDSRYFKSFIDFRAATENVDNEGDDLESTSPEFGNTLCPNLEVDSRLRFQFHDLDFGGGSPCVFFPPNIPVEGLIIFLPTCSEDGGVDVVILLLPEHVPLFKQISRSMDDYLN